MLVLALLVPASASAGGRYATTAEVDFVTGLVYKQREKITALTARVNALEAKTTKLETAVAGLPTTAQVESLIDLKLVPINLRLVALEPQAPSCTVTQYEGSGFITFLKNAKPNQSYTVQVGQLGEQNYATANATTDSKGTATYEGQWVFNGKPISILWYAANPVASCTN